MSHLGSLVSALADGQLAPGATERALAHVAACPECAGELAAARAARSALAAAFEVTVDPDLTRRLIALGATRVEDSRAARFADGSVPLPGSHDEHRLPAGCLDGDLTRPRRVPGRWLVVATTGVGVLTATLFTLGEQPDVVPAAHPAHALTVLGRAATTASPWTGAVAVVQSTRVESGPAGSAPAESERAESERAESERAEPARAGRATMRPDVPATVGSAIPTEPTPQQVVAELEELGWTAPPTVPVGYQITAVRPDAEGPDSVELDLTGDHGTIVVTLRHGRLAPEAVPTAETVELDGGTLHVLSTAPWHGVWQCGDTVVSVVAQVPSEALDQVITSFPAQQYDAGVPARISRGWVALAGAWNP